MSRLVVVSNRVSLPTERAQRAGGLAVAIREALERTGGLWFGWSGETPDAPSAQATRVTRGKVEYALIDLAPAEFEGFYNGYANSTLWPLFHYLTDRYDSSIERTSDGRQRVEIRLSNDGRMDVNGWPADSRPRGQRSSAPGR